MSGSSPNDVLRTLRLQQHGGRDTAAARFHAHVQARREAGEHGLHHVSTSSCSWGRWERGETVPSLTTQAALATFLNVKVGDLGFGPTVTLAMSPSDAIPDHGGHSYGEPAVNRVADIASHWTQVALAHPDLCDVHRADFAPRLPHRVIVDPLTMRGLHARLTAARIVDDQCGARIALPETLVLVARTAEYAEHSPPDQLDGLCGFFAELVQFLGWLFFDLGLDEEAWEAHRHGIDVLRGPQHAPIEAYLLASMGYLKLCAGDVDSARDHVWRAMSRDDRLDGEQDLRTYLNCMSALVFAHSGQDADCRAALDAARKIWATRATAAPGALELPWLDEGRIDAYEGYCLKQLHEFGEALTALRRAWSQALPSVSRVRASALAAIAQVEAILGHAAEAHQAIVWALDAMEGAVSPRVLRQLMMLIADDSSDGAAELAERLKFVARRCATVSSVEGTTEHVSDGVALLLP